MKRMLPRQTLMSLLPARLMQRPRAGVVAYQLRSWPAIVFQLMK